MNDKYKIRLNFKLILTILIVGSYVANGVVITLFSVSMSETSSKLQENIKVLEEENRTISSQLHSKTSLYGMYEKSADLGYSATGEIMYINGEEPVAELR